MILQKEFLEYWDTIRLILESINYGNKIQTTKIAMKEALYCAGVLSKSISDDEFELKISFSRLFIAENALDELSDGILNKEVQENICECLRSIQQTLADLFYEHNFKKDIDNAILNDKFCEEVLKCIIKDHILRDYRL